MTPDDAHDGPALGGRTTVANAARAAVPTVFDDWDRLQREYEYVIAFVMRGGASLADAEDATQFAYMQAWILMKRPGGWSTIRNPRGWIRTVAWNKYRRTHGPAVPVPEIPEPARRDDDPSALPALATSLIDALRRLKDERQRIVMLLAMDGFTAVEIAAVLAPDGRGVTPKDVQRVRDQLKRARSFVEYQLADPERW